MWGSGKDKTQNKKKNESEHERLGQAGSTELTPFIENSIRRVWHNGEWYYSIIDVISFLTGSTSPRKYWSALKSRAKSEGFDQTIEQLKLVSPDGKLRQTDTANRQTILRIIQSVPSPNAEPFRLWLAQVGEERLDEVENPGNALERIRQNYRAKGYTNTWIEQRIQTDVTRNELTDEWRERGVRHGQEFATLTNDIHEGTFDLSVEAHKNHKRLPTRTNLRDHMTNLELALISLGEATTTQFHRRRESEGFEALRKDAKDAGALTGDTRRNIEERLGGDSVVSPENYLAQQKQARLEARNTKTAKSPKTQAKNGQMELFSDD